MENSCTIRQIRDELGLTQQELAGKLGVTRKYISMLETGIKPVSKKMIPRLKKLYDLKNEKVTQNCTSEKTCLSDIDLEMSEIKSRLSVIEKLLLQLLSGLQKP